MKLEKYENKSMSKRKVLLIGLSVIVLVSVSLLFYKNNNLKENKDNVYFAFYNSNEKLDSMPEKDNEENLVFDYGVCDNGAYVEWNSEEWAPLIRNLTKNKTKCSLYFKEKTSINICNKYGSDSALCYISKLGDSDYENMTYDHASANGVLDNNLRYVGADPNNYISFNNEIWRIIGVMNNIVEVGEDENKTETTGSYIKLMKKDSLGTYSWDSSSSDINNGNGVNEWSDADIQKVLNNDYLYKENRGGICYSWYNNQIKDCPTWETVGIDNNAREMIANIKWNTSASNSNNLKQSYGKERGNLTGLKCNPITPTCNDTVERTTKWVGKVGLIYPSDYGYAVGGELKNTCLNKANMELYKEDCYKSDWVYSKSAAWTITPYVWHAYSIYHTTSEGKVATNGVVANENIYPVVYLKTNVKILPNPKSELEYGSIDNPFILSQN